MFPEWNIKGVIVEPGGFRTDWAGGSLVRVPSLPPYDSEDSPSVLFKKHVTSQTFIGDPARAAKALVQIADMEEPPLRIQLGSESLLIVRHKSMKTISDGRKFEELTHSTNVDGIDKNTVLDMFPGVDA